MTQLLNNTDRFFVWVIVLLRYCVIFVVRILYGWGKFVKGDLMLWLKGLEDDTVSTIVKSDNLLLLQRFGVAIGSWK